jgi:hypothetical protein
MKYYFIALVFNVVVATTAWWVVDVFLSKQGEGYGYMEGNNAR